ncbi:Detected protein of unknown function [Hibiscus syriacus]|uniref:Uncharacterized protein n=1 Tax=Hibiscus syriacus TaxID=106335 RepID=A0A6A2ZV74_HIBSY|nr:Detected protein of unknown function [Hibiscus syriacus]
MESNRTAYEDNQVSHPSSSSWDATDSPPVIPNRIPAHVFAPTSTTSQAEWSTASNESLFSIHLGNMSFNESSLMYTPGELDSPMMSSPLFDFLVPSATPKSTQYGMKSGEEDDCGSFNAAAAETMLEVLREKESQHINNIVEETNLGRSMSQLSDASAKSFAFPM